jgi:hypothetical protein
LRLFARVGSSQMRTSRDFVCGFSSSSGLRLLQLGDAEGSQALLGQDHLAGWPILTRRHQFQMRLPRSSRFFEGRGFRLPKSMFIATGVVGGWWPIHSPVTKNLVGASPPSSHFSSRDPPIQPPNSTIDFSLCISRSNALHPKVTSENDVLRQPVLLVELSPRPFCCSASASARGKFTRAHHATFPSNRAIPQLDSSLCISGSNALHATVTSDSLFQVLFLDAFTRAVANRSAAPPKKDHRNRSTNKEDFPDFVRPCPVA